MTLYEKIIEYDIDTLAAFIYGIVADTEEGMLKMLSNKGIECSLVNLSPDLRIANNVLLLSQEVLDEQDT